MDILTILPNFSTKPFTHIIPSLEKARISTVDLITLDTLEIAKRAHVPPTDVRRLSASVVEALHHDLGFENVQAASERHGNGESDLISSNDRDGVLEPGPSTKLDPSRWNAISTLDSALDALLGGGVPCGYVTEVTGESGSGKTQFLLGLLLAVQLPSPQGLGKRAIYISTEAPLATNRLSQMLRAHPELSSLPREGLLRPSLENILSINAMDLETQEHILNYQLPIAIARYDVGLVVIDSITANFRAEHSSDGISSLSARSFELAKLGQTLRNLAAQEHIAIVVANQVSDRFDSSGGIGGNLNFYRNGVMPRNSNQVMFTDSGVTVREATSPRSWSRIDEAASGRATGTAGMEPALSQTHNFLIPSPSSPASSSQVDDEQPDGTYLVGNPARLEMLSLAHQQRFFTGWGDSPPIISLIANGYRQPADKTPALGFVWSTQIACRIALKKEEGPVLVDMADGGGVGQGVYEQQQQQHSTEPGAQPEHIRTLYQHSDNVRQNPAQTEVEPAVLDDDEEVQKKQTSPYRNTTAIPDSVPRPSVHSPVPVPVSVPIPSEVINRVTRRTMKLVFAPWTAGNQNRKAGLPDETSTPSSSSSRGHADVDVVDEVDFEIYEGGLRSVPSQR